MPLPGLSILKQDYLFGISLFDGNGNMYPDEAISRWLDKAVGWLEYELDVAIKPTLIQEDHDYNAEDYQAFCYINLYQFPVIEVESLTAGYGGQIIMTFPQDWIKLYPESGQIQLVPTIGSMSTILLEQGAGILLPLITGALSTMPHLFQVAYTTGFGKFVYSGTAQTGGSQGSVILDPGASNQDNAYNGMRIIFYDGVCLGQAADILAYSGETFTATLKPDSSFPDLSPLANIPDGCSYKIFQDTADANIAELVAMKASIGILTVLGDILYQPGVASSSLSLDGISQSFSLTRSAQGGAYSGRIKQYEERIDRELGLLKKRYQGFRLNVA